MSFRSVLFGSCAAVISASAAAAADATVSPNQNQSNMFASVTPMAKVSFTSPERKHA